jgi:hypothetical protein
MAGAEDERSAVSHAIDALEGQLRAQLDHARAQLEHMGNRGSAAEDAFRDFLARHLPRRFDVGHGEVVDTHGARSGQVDVIVSNEDQPFRHGDRPGCISSKA